MGVAMPDELPQQTDNLRDRLAASGFEGEFIRTDDVWQFIIV